MERATLRNKLSKLKLIQLRSYIQNFDRFLNEYQLLDGDRSTEDNIHAFMSCLPCDKYLQYKTLFQPKTIDEAFYFFRKIADAENTYRKTEG